MTETTAVALPTEGPGAPPRENGELVFDAPWQGRAFGVAAALVEQGQFTWSDFQAALITTVGHADTDGRDTGQPACYWQCWLDALALVAEAGDLVGSEDWSARCLELAARPVGHDH